MQAWLIGEHARARIEELSAEARRYRLARGTEATGRVSLRRRVAYVLVAIGSSLADAGNRVLDDAAVVR
jgi:hypothetical protein